MSGIVITGMYGMEKSRFPTMKITISDSVRNLDSSRFHAKRRLTHLPCLRIAISFQKLWKVIRKTVLQMRRSCITLRRTFLYPKDFESLIYISQVLQAIAIKSGSGALAQKQGRCMGAIYWQLNDNWPVASWASIDYFGRWKALQYFSRYFYADVLGSLKVSADAVYTPYLQNETMQEVSSDVTVFVKICVGKCCLKLHSAQSVHHCPWKHGTGIFERSDRGQRKRRSLWRRYLHILMEL